MRRKRILVACGTAIATSTHVAARLKELCRHHSIDVEIIQARVQEIPAYADSVDLIVATTQVASRGAVPVVSGIPFLTGIGEEGVQTQILEILQKGD